MPLIIPMPVYTQLLSDGSLVIVDYGLKTINHFDSEGSLISTAGGEGRGPGEYQSISAVSIRDDGKVAVADISSAAITVSGICVATGKCEGNSICFRKPCSIFGMGLGLSDDPNTWSAAVCEIAEQ